MYDYKMTKFTNSYDRKVQQLLQTKDSTTVLQEQKVRWKFAEKSVQQELKERLAKIITTKLRGRQHGQSIRINGKYL